MLPKNREDLIARKEMVEHQEQMGGKPIRHTNALIVAAFVCFVVIVATAFLAL